MGAESETSLPNALVVDDEKEVADAYALRLRGACEIRTVYDGESALETFEAWDVDVALLDRHMPGMSGDDVLEALADHPTPVRVIMVTAIDPGFDVLDMPFDDYLCKPVDRADIRSAVTQQCQILGYDLLGEYFGVESKRRVIEAELPQEQRQDHDEYVQLSERAERLRTRITRLLADADALFEQFDDVDRAGR